jgi:cell division septation protein DedD
MAVGLLALTALASAVLLRGSNERLEAAGVCTSTVPRGALAPAIPEFCKMPLAPIAETFTQGANSWSDNFNAGSQHNSMGSYVTGTYGISNSNALFWRHNEHWMVDIQGPTDQGGAYMRPPKSFVAENGAMVVETEVADAAYGLDPNVWPEVTISRGAAPTKVDLYFYEAMDPAPTFGCRLQRDGFPICEYRNNGGRVFEASDFQTDHAASSFGGGPWAAPGAWKTCNSTQDPDATCRNVFRLTVTQNSFRLDVNGQRYFEQKGVPSMAALLNGPMYVYNASTLWRVDGDVFRYHWDHFAVNPGSTGTLPQTQGTPTPTPAATATPKVTATPSATATPKATVTATPTASATATPKATTTATPKATVTATPKATTTPSATPTPVVGGVLAGRVPSNGFALLVVKSDSSIETIVAELESKGCNHPVIAARVGREWKTYISFAPARVNRGFPASLPANTVLFIRC